MHSLHTINMQKQREVKEFDPFLLPLGDRKKWPRTEEQYKKQRQTQRIYRQTHKEEIREMNKIYKSSHRDEVNRRKREWARRNYNWDKYTNNVNGFREKTLKYKREWSAKIKLRALEMVGRGRIECALCRINNIIVLQIHHNNGDPQKEHNQSDRLRRDIVRGKRSIDDLRLLCGNCHLIVDWGRRHDPTKGT